MSGAEPPAVSRLEMARAGFDAFNRGDFDGVLAILSPDVEVHSEGEVGETGTYHGHDGYRAWTTVWLDAWGDFAIEVLDVEEVDDRNFVVHSHQRGTGRGSGVEVTQETYYLFTLGDDDLVTRLHLYGSRDEALRAARS